MSNILGNLLENLLTFCYAFSFIFGHMLLLPNCTCHAENACQRNTGLLFFFFLFYKVLFGKAKVMTNTHNRSFFFNQVISSVQSLSPVQLFETPWTAACQASVSVTNPRSLLKLMSILCCPLLLLPSIFPSIKVFSNESVLHIKWPKYWSFSFSISPSNEYLVLISFRMDLLDVLAVQGTLKSLLQHHS